MIPRVRVNYTLRALLGSLWPSRASRMAKRRLQEELTGIYGLPVLLTPSGRGGLYFALRAIDRPKVLVPAYTCKAVVEAALLAGKTVTHVAMEPSGFNMDPDDVERQADGESVVIATHQYGIPCDIERIVAAARKKGALVVEDAAASFGSTVGGRLTGTYGDAACFSFDSTKTIHVPLKGGFVVSSDPALFTRIERLYRQEIRPMPVLVGLKTFLAGLAYLAIEHPLVYRVFHFVNFTLRGQFTADSPDMASTPSPFYRYDMSRWQAHVALEQVQRRDEIFRARRAQYEQYSRQLGSCVSLTPPPRDDRHEWVCTRFPVLVPRDKMAFYAAALRHGVDMAFSFTFIAAPPDETRAHALAGQVLNLPYYPKLKPAEFDHVVRTCRALDARGEVDR